MERTDISNQSRQGPLTVAAAAAVAAVPVRPKPTKPLFFTATNPLEVVITEVGNNWAIQPSAAHKPIMITRLDGKEPTGQTLGDTGDGEWQARGHKPGKDHPPFKRDPHHVPIMMLEGESVKITCDPPYAFEVTVGRDPDVNPDSVFPGPASPFGWTGSRNAPAGGSVMAAVTTPALDSTGTPIEDGPREQRFYKFSAIVTLPNGKKVYPDPDGFCDR